MKGIFLRIRSDQRQPPRSIMFLAGFVIVILWVLMSVATRANSGIGIPVVATTVAFGIGVMALSTLLRRWLAAKQTQVPPPDVANQELSAETPRAAILTRSSAPLAVVIALILTLVVFAYSLAVLPSYGIDLPARLVGGGVVMYLLLLLIIEWYPRLHVRGSPGVLAAAGFAIVFSMLYMTFVSWYIVPFNPTQLNVGPLLGSPTLANPLGTTSIGQDLLSRTITGGAIMLQVALLSVLVCFSIGVPAGLMASYSGGVADRAVSLVMDSIFAFPGLVLAIAIAAMLGPGVVNMALAIAVVYIPSYFRVVRSQVLTVKELPYVEAAVVMGARNREILLRYILPNVLPSAVVVMSINFADAVLTAAGLTFVGLGLPVNIPDWGWDLSFGWRQLIVGAWWVITFPGLMIVFLALGFTLIGEGFNEILTPRLKE